MTILQLADKLQFLPLIFNVLMAVLYSIAWQPGKALYWIGASILTYGLILMKG